MFNSSANNSQASPQPSNAPFENGSLNTSYVNPTFKSSFRLGAFESYENNSLRIANYQNKVKKLFESNSQSNPNSNDPYKSPQNPILPKNNSSRNLSSNRRLSIDDAKSLVSEQGSMGHRSASRDGFKLYNNKNEEECNGRYVRKNDFKLPPRPGKNREERSVSDNK